MGSARVHVTKTVSRTKVSGKSKGTRTRVSNVKSSGKKLRVRKTK